MIPKADIADCWKIYWDKCLRSQGEYFEEDPGIIVLGRLLFLLTLNGLIISRLTSYMYLSICAEQPLFHRCNIGSLLLFYHYFQMYRRSTFFSSTRSNVYSHFYRVETFSFLAWPKAKDKVPPRQLCPPRTVTLGFMWVDVVDKT